MLFRSVGHDPVIHQGTAGSKRAMQLRGQFFRQGYVFRTADPLADGNQDVRFTDVHILRRNKPFQPFERAGTRRGSFPDQLPGPVRIRDRGGKDFRTDGGHLGPAVRADDGRHQVPAEGRTGLIQQACVRIRGQGGAVRRETGAQPRRDPGRQGTAEGGCTDQQDGGIIFPDQAGKI